MTKPNAAISAVRSLFLSIRQTDGPHGDFGQIKKEKFDAVVARAARELPANASAQQCRGWLAILRSEFPDNFPAAAPTSPPLNATREQIAKMSPEQKLSLGNAIAHAKREKKS